MHAGELKEGLISVGSTQPVEPDPLDPEIIQRFSNKFIYQNASVAHVSLWLKFKFLEL